jgi:hypothetical protein
MEFFFTPKGGLKVLLIKYVFLSFVYFHCQILALDDLIEIPI